MLDLYQLGLNSNTNVAIRGGNDKTSYYTSLSYKKARSTSEKNTFERYSFLLKGSHKISDRVEVSAAMSFTNSNPKNSPRTVGERFVNPNGTIMTPMLDVNYFRDKYLGEHGGLASTSYGDKYGSVPGRDLFFMIDNTIIPRKRLWFVPKWK